MDMIAWQQWILLYHKCHCIISLLKWKSPWRLNVFLFVCFLIFLFQSCLLHMFLSSTMTTDFSLDIDCSISHCRGRGPQRSKVSNQHIFKSSNLSQAKGTAWLIAHCLSSFQVSWWQGSLFKVLLLVQQASCCQFPFARNQRQPPMTQTPVKVSDDSVILCVYDNTADKEYKWKWSSQLWSNLSSYK